MRKTGAMVQVARWRQRRRKKRRQRQRQRQEQEQEQEQARVRTGGQKGAETALKFSGGEGKIGVESAGGRRVPELEHQR